LSISRREESNARPVAAKFLDYLESTPVQQANLAVFGGSVNKNVKSDSKEPLDLAWEEIFADHSAVFVNGDQAFPLDVTTEYFRVINEVASDHLDPKAAAGALQKFIAARK
jgi:raffinose/stachyose/melibiose transport system substrate-binding protein